MPDASQSEIGILPCPGGMEFARTIYSHLESITAEKMEERVRALSRLYGLPEGGDDPPDQPRERHPALLG